MVVDRDGHPVVFIVGIDAITERRVTGWPTS
jgi:hypothetical protein